MGRWRAAARGPRLGEVLEATIDYLADHEPTTAGYLARGAWIVRTIAEEETAEERPRPYTGSNSSKRGQRRRFGCRRALW